MLVRADWSVHCKCSHCVIFLCRAEGEYSYVSCWLSAAGWGGGRDPQAGGGGVQPGLPVNVKHGAG